MSKSVLLKQINHVWKKYVVRSIKEKHMKNFAPAWEDLSDSKKITSKHVIQHCVLRAMKEELKGERKGESLLREYLLKAFTPVSRSIKLKNGRRPYDAISKAKAERQNFFTVLNHNIEDFFETHAEVSRYVELFRSITEDDLDRYYVYIFVRQDISPEQQLVQAAHATLILGHELQNRKKVDNLYFTVIGVSDRNALFDIQGDLKFYGHKFIEFNEPDIGNEETAIATYPIAMKNRGKLLEYKLLRFKK